ncbi:putative cytokinetic ring protein SteA [Actinomyces gaoshouyii]|uniref:Thiamin pyrophosphokinase n=1 Tax=Actinomyces gaoshouyii TaxID=1960083 RepID=A0A8H9H9B7_9ACTO|nr:putative cytokinetic ring protein SteA [Actinomyces gaoshouyii]ARD41555.1 thiamin pyrophosphokinase [Actinomyces gaoshouyii]GGO98323.1 thiamin pyrophosphokinase [Actinomyces gaoshouyii]
MRFPFHKHSPPDDRPVGVVRVDARTKDLVKRLNPGDIAVINHSDLDRVAAESLVEKRPAAVLNASPSVSGRYPNLGPGILVDAGIPLIDGLGADIMRLREGDRIIVADGAVRLEGEDAIIAEGTVQTPGSVEASMEVAKEGLAVQLEAFAANTMEYMKRERDLLLNGIGMPEIRTSMAGKHVLVVVRGYSYKEDLKALRSYIRDCKPVIIGVDGGADAVIEAGFKPTMIVGDMDSVSDRALRSGAEIVVHAYRDGRAPGLARVEALGVDHVVFSATGTSEDIAMLMADEADAELIVALGTHATLLEFLDKGRAGMSSTFLTRLKVGGRLIDAKGVSRLYRTRISSWHLFFLAVAGLFALWAALQSTPAGQTFFGLFGATWDDFINFLRSLVGLSPRTPSL